MRSSDVVGGNLGDLGRLRCSLLLILLLWLGVELLLLDRLLLACVDISHGLLLLLIHSVLWLLILILLIRHIRNLWLLTVATAEHTRDTSTLEQTGST